MQTRKTLCSFTVSMLLFTSLVPARDDESARTSLHGLKLLLIYIREPDADSSKHVSLQQLKAALFQQIELKLRTAGLTVSSPTKENSDFSEVIKYLPEDQARQFAFLDVQTTVRSTNQSSLVFASVIAISQFAALTRDTSMTGLGFPETWSTIRVGTSTQGTLAKAIKQAVDEGLEQFISAYRKVNPKL